MIKLMKCLIFLVLFCLKKKHHIFFFVFHEIMDSLICLSFLPSFNLSKKLTYAGFFFLIFYNDTAFLFGIHDPLWQDC